MTLEKLRAMPFEEMSDEFALLLWKNTRAKKESFLLKLFEKIKRTFS